MMKFWQQSATVSLLVSAFLAYQHASYSAPKQSAEKRAYSYALQARKLMAEGWTPDSIRQQIKLLNAAVEIAPKSAHFYCLRGDIYLTSQVFNGDIRIAGAQAFADYSRAVELRPNSWFYRKKRVAAFYALELEDRTETGIPPYSVINDLNKFISLKPNDGQAYAERASAKPFTRQAISDYTKALTLLSNDEPYASRTDLYRGRAEAHVALGEHKLATVDYTNVLQCIDKKHPDKDLTVKALSARAQSFYALGSYPNVVRDISYALAVKFKPEEYNSREPEQLYYLRGHAQMHLKQYQAAIKDFTLLCDESNPEIYTLRAQCYHALGNEQAAHADERAARAAEKIQEEIGKNAG